ncbi:uncharacterized protein [Miscanthus floridulus]|uniref:uncharacterized protein n=1 Tax=Miscanthus floridulus TaxID=154761 RepID=UPI003458E5CA
MKMATAEVHNDAALGDGGNLTTSTHSIWLFQERMSGSRDVPRLGVKFGVGWGEVRQEGVVGRRTAAGEPNQEDERVGHVPCNCKYCLKSSPPVLVGRKKKNHVQVDGNCKRVARPAAKNDSKECADLLRAYSYAYPR